MGTVQCSNKVWDRVKTRIHGAQSTGEWGCKEANPLCGIVVHATSSLLSLTSMFIFCRRLSCDFMTLWALKKVCQRPVTAIFQFRRKPNARRNLFASIAPVPFLSFFWFRKLWSLNEPIKWHKMCLRLERIRSAWLTTLVMNFYVMTGKVMLFSDKCAVSRKS